MNYVKEFLKRNGINRRKMKASLDRAEYLKNFRLSVNWDVKTMANLIGCTALDLRRVENLISMIPIESEKNYILIEKCLKEKHYVKGDTRLPAFEIIIDTNETATKRLDLRRLLLKLEKTYGDESTLAESLILLIELKRNKAFKKSEYFEEIYQSTLSRYTFLVQTSTLLALEAASLQQLIQSLEALQGAVSQQNLGTPQ